MTCETNSRQSASTAPTNRTIATMTILQVIHVTNRRVKQTTIACEKRSTCIEIHRLPHCSICLWKKSTKSNIDLLKLLSKAPVVRLTCCMPYLSPIRVSKPITLSTKGGKLTAVKTSQTHYYPQSSTPTPQSHSPHPHISPSTSPSSSLDNKASVPDHIAGQQRAYSTLPKG